MADLYHTSQPPQELWPAKASRNNGTDAEALERFKIREICEGWGCYRDAAEWNNYRSMFHSDAYITTSWKQGSIDEFIKASMEGFALGSTFMYIQHRIIGMTVDLQGNRAVSKMKVTITCRFTFEGIEVDNEADCCFFYLLEKREGKWGISFITLLFNKDKMIPVQPGKCFSIPEEEVMKYPSGYRYLAWCEAKIGRPPKMDLNAHGPEKEILYSKCKDWLDGKVVKPNLTGKDIVNI
ncbi:MAG: hypothetical protein M1834_004834 [Cirrosporium novae-zelandiae]|nr:MAG: hypothetical protein M1834_004834 [Cirrosporium novae-zelandiae]